MQHYSKARKSRLYRWSDKHLFSAFAIILLLFFVFDEGVDELEEDTSSGCGVRTRPVKKNSSEI